jgi:hypothetical protein
MSLATHGTILATSSDVLISPARVIRLLTYRCDASVYCLGIPPSVDGASIGSFDPDFDSIHSIPVSRARILQ